MSELPERIWATEFSHGDKSWTDNPRIGKYRKEREYIRKDVSDAEKEAVVAAAREDALREAAERIDRKIKQVQPEMTRRAQRLAEGKKPGFQYALHRADLDARISDRDMILDLIDRTAEGEA